MKITFFTLCILMSSCTFMRKNGEHRHIQTQVLASLGSKKSEFAKCGRITKIYKHFKTSRVRVILSLNIDQDGKLEQFRLDNRDYPESFSECIFDVVELIKFPKNKKYKTLHVEQPFIFSKKQ